MIQAFVLVVAACLLAACTSLTPIDSTPPQAGAEQADSSAAAAQEAPPDADDGLPELQLSASLLYQLLAGEVAAQRDEFDIATQAYRQAADYARDPRLARRATQVAVYANNYASALHSARLWVELSPASMDARQSLVVLLLRMGETDDAVTQLKQVLANTDPEHGFALVGSVLSRESDTRRALLVMDQLLASHPNQPEALFTAAGLAYQRGEPEQAQTYLERLESLAPMHARALALKAELLRQLGHEDDALATYQEALKTFPQEASLRLSYARMLLDLKRTGEAREQFRLLGKQLPDNTEIAFTEGLLAVHSGDLDRAETLFRRLAERGERSDDAAYALGQIAESRKRPDEALQWYQQVTDGNNYLDAVIRIAVITHTQQGLPAALLYLSGVELQAPEQEITLRLAEGELLRDSGQYADAQDTYDQALAQFPDSIELLYARALNAERLDRLELLESDLKAILQLQPDNAQALNALGYTLADRTDRTQEAYELIKRALELMPDEPAIMDSMGWALYRLGKIHEAETWLRRAFEAFNDGEVAAHLGEVLWVQGQTEEARALWDEALKKDPDHDVLLRTIQRLTQ